MAEELKTVAMSGDDWAFAAQGLRREAKSALQDFELALALAAPAPSAEVEGWRARVIANVARLEEVAERFEAAGRSAAGESPR